MGQAMEIDILEVHKSKTLLHAHFLLKFFHLFCKWCKTTKRFTLFKISICLPIFDGFFLEKQKGGSEKVEIAFLF